MIKNETEQYHSCTLPGETHPDYFRVLVRNCIAAYSKLFSDTLALDYNKVVEREMRALILDDREYQKETRSIRAKQMMAEVQEVEELAALAEGGGDDSDDPRDKGRKKRVSNADKDMLTMRFRAAQMRRDLLHLSENKEDKDEADALNLFFVPLSQAELQRLKTVEENVGQADGKNALAETDNNNLPDRDEVRKKLGVLEDDTEEQAFIDTAYRTNPDGSIEEV